MDPEQTHHAREFCALMAHIETGLDEYSIQTLIDNNEKADNHINQRQKPHD